MPFRSLEALINQILAVLANSNSSLSQAHPRHTRSGVGTNRSQVDPDVRSRHKFAFNEPLRVAPLGRLRAFG
jgi:hypothetical protein